MAGKTPKLLAVNSSLWRTALAVMQLCGLTEKQAMQVASNNPDVPRSDWLAVGPLANRLAVQRCLQLTAGQVYERHAAYVVGNSAKRVAGRLLFLRHHSLQHLLVAKKQEALQQWRRQHGLRPERRAPAEPPLISLRDVPMLTDTDFASLPAVQAAGGLPALQSFTAGLESNPPWQELQAAAEAEQARLLPLLPRELQLAVVKRQQAARKRRRTRSERDGEED